MHPKSPKWLDDVVRACHRIEHYTHGYLQENYEGNRLVRDAVERNLMIIGEALQRIERVDAQTASGITDYQIIIALRHRLAHGYDDDIDDARIWVAIRNSVPALRMEAQELLAEAESSYEEHT